MEHHVERPRRRKRRYPMALALLAGALVAGVAAPASAAGPTGTVSVNGSQLVYTAVAGVTNALTFDFRQLSVPNRILVDDTAGRPTPGAGCANGPTATSVICVPTGITSAVFTLGDMGDNANVVDNGKMAGRWIEVNGGTGDDFITSQLATASGTPAQLRGNGQDGFDTIRGSNGNDILTGGNDNDDLTGDSTAPGAPQGNDTITGGAGVDILEGLGGNDGLNGNAGMDFMYAGAGNDLMNAHGDATAELVLDCNSGTDTLNRDAQDAAGTPATGCETINTI